MFSVRLSDCLAVCPSACLSIIYPSVSFLHVSSPYLLHQWKLFFNFLIPRWYAEFIVITNSVKERHGHTLKYKAWSDDVQRKRTITLLSPLTYAHLFVAYREMESASYLCHKLQDFFVNVWPNVHHTELIRMFTFCMASFRLVSFRRENTKWHKLATLSWIAYPSYQTV